MSGSDKIRAARSRAARNTNAYRLASARVRAQNPAGKVQATKALKATVLEQFGTAKNRYARAYLRGIAADKSTYGTPDERFQATLRDMQSKQRVPVNPMKNSAPSEAARRFGGGRFGGNASSFGRIR